MTSVAERIYGTDLFMHLTGPEWNFIQTCEDQTLCAEVAGLLGSSNVISNTTAATCCKILKIWDKLSKEEVITLHQGVEMICGYSATFALVLYVPLKKKGKRLDWVKRVEALVDAHYRNKFDKG